MTKDAKPVKLHMGALAVAMLFLWNPFLRMLDVLPDVAGYALILWATSKIADLSPSMADARKRFQRLLWISIAKPVLQFLLIVWQARQSFTDKGLPVIIILVVTGFELFYFITAFSDFFAGLDFLAMRYDGQSVFHGEKDVKSMTTVSGIVRCGLCVLPELGDLLGGPYNGSLAEDAFDLAKYGTLFQATNLLLGGILGLVWLSMALPYFRRIAGEGDFLARMEEAYRKDVLPNTGLFLRRGIRNAFIMLVLGGIGLLDLYIDGIDLIPDFLASIFLTIGVMLLGRWVPLFPRPLRSKRLERGIPLACGIASFVIGVIHFYLSVAFSDEYYQYVVVSGLQKVPVARPLYTALLVLAVAQACLLVALFMMTKQGMLQAIRLHVGRALLGNLSERAELEDRRLRSELKIRVLWMYGVMLAYLTSKVVYGVCFCSLPIWWMPHLILGGVALYLLWTRQGELYEQVEYKYL